ncbi:hypothetical protein GIB67_013112 [Kingdonia uniflora]|uniref:RNase H type-1 domain-containing protein n=1 Tax=Kingdonia uniflora TaxID=39325 RepID=A0A7J7NNW3_9MAGN|nr:hypothetical protein GIB67_013112 [Kingdonia uniflora]
MHPRLRRIQLNCLPILHTYLIGTRSSKMTENGIKIPSRAKLLISTFFRTEKLNLRSWSSRAKLLGTIISISGAFIVTIFFSTPLQLSLPPQLNWIPGGILRAITCLLAAIWNVLQATTVKKYPSQMTVVFFYCFFGTIQCAIFSLIAKRDLSAWRWWIIGDESNIDFWRDIWATEVPLRELMDLPKNLWKNCTTKLSTFINRDGWNIPEDIKMWLLAMGINTGYAGIGVVYRDDKKVVLGALSKAIGVTTNYMAEIQAILDGLQKAVENGWLKGVFGSVFRTSIYTWGIHKKGPLYVAMFRPIGIVIAVVMGVSFLGDTLHVGRYIIRRNFFINYEPYRF